MQISLSRLIVGADGNPATLTQVAGELNGKADCLECIVNEMRQSM